MHSFATIVVALSLPLYAIANHQGNHAHRHSDVAHHARANVTLAKRGVSFTYYDITTGTTACGGNFKPSDYVVALNAAEFGSGYPGPKCFKSITLNCGGRTASATIQDECMGCDPGGIDLTEGLFRYISNNNMGAGKLQCDWSYGGGGGDPPPPSSEPHHTTSTPPPPPPPPSSTSSYDPPSSTPHTTSTPSSSSSSSSTSTTSNASKSGTRGSTTQSFASSPTTTPTSSMYSYGGLAQPTGTITSDGQPDVLDLLFRAIIGIGNVDLAFKP